MVTDGEKTPDIMSLKVKVGPYVTFSDSMPITHTIPGADARAGRTSEGSMAAEETRTSPDVRGRLVDGRNTWADEAQSEPAREGTKLTKQAGLREKEAKFNAGSTL